MQYCTCNQIFMVKAEFGTCASEHFLSEPFKWPVTSNPLLFLDHVMPWLVDSYFHIFSTMNNLIIHSDSAPQSLDSPWRPQASAVQRALRMFSTHPSSQALGFNNLPTKKFCSSCHRSTCKEIHTSKESKKSIPKSKHTNIPW